MDLLVCPNLMINMFPNISHFTFRKRYCFFITLLSLENYLVTSSFFFVCVQTANLWSRKYILKAWTDFQGCFDSKHLLLSKIPVVPPFHSSFSVTDHQEYKDLHSAFILQPSVLYFTLSLYFLWNSCSKHHNAFNLKNVPIWRTLCEN